MNSLRKPIDQNGGQALTPLLLVLLFAFFLPYRASADNAPPSPERQAAIQTLLHQECGSCHGLHLNGGLGPALTSSALQGQTVEQIALTITHGRPGTAMPAWSPFLQAAESQWLADFLLHASDSAP